MHPGIAGLQPEAKDEKASTEPFRQSISLVALPAETAVFLEFPIHGDGYVSIIRYIPELDHLVSFLGQLAPPAGLSRVLLNRLILAAIHGKPDVPKPMSAGAAHAEFLALHLELVMGHEVRRD